MPTFHFKPEIIHLLTWFRDSPDTGNPDCICSLCGNMIEEGEVLLRLFRDNNTEMRLHMDPCARQVIVELAPKPESQYKHNPAYAEGWTAFEAATRRGANPYGTKGPESSRNAWYAGWDAAWEKSNSRTDSRENSGA